MIFSLIIVLSPTKIQTAYAASETTYYARINEDGERYFYSSPYEQSKLFVLPSTFFVLLSGIENDFYKATFRDVSGYVKISDVTPVKNKPLQEYPDTSFRVLNENGLVMYSSPTTEAEPVGRLDYLQEKVTLYGTMSGTMVIPNSTRTWFYCSTFFEGRVVRGYAFSYLCDEVITPGINNETFEAITTPLDFSPPKNQTNGLSDTTVAIIVLCVCLPCLVILYLLLSPGKRHKVQRSEKKIKVKRGKDYYELNEDDL